MDFIEIKLPKCVVYLTPDEIKGLLQKDTELYMTALKRGKGISRKRKQKSRERQKWQNERGSKIFEGVPDGNLEKAQSLLHEFGEEI